MSISNFCTLILGTAFKANLLKYMFVINEPEIFPNGTQCRITTWKFLAGCNIVFNETELRLGSGKDISGSRSRIHTNAMLNYEGSCHTRGSGHVTGGFTFIRAGKFLPPLILFSSSAENEANYAINDESVVTLLTKPQLSMATHGTLRVYRMLWSASPARWTFVYS
jgi:hypothetical protein